MENPKLVFAWILPANGFLRNFRVRGNRDFDSDETIRPAKITKAIWDKFYDLSFGDFSKLIAPKKLVFCEGTPNGGKYKNFDAQIYNVIFGPKYHDTKFISLGSCTELENLDSMAIGVVANILESSEIIKIVDRDDKSPQEIAELKAKGIKTIQKASHRVIFA